MGRELGYGEREGDDELFSSHAEPQITMRHPSGDV